MKLSSIYRPKNFLTEEEKEIKDNIDQLFKNIKKNEKEIIVWPVSSICYKAHNDLFSVFQEPSPTENQNQKIKNDEKTLNSYTIKDTIEVLNYILWSRSIWLHAKKTKQNHVPQNNNIPKAWKKELAA